MPEEPDGRFDATEYVTTLLRHLFHECFWPDRPESAAGELKAAVPPGAFLQWLAATLNLQDADAICERLEVPRKVWDFLAEGVHSGQGVQILGNVWYAVVLSDRPPPQAPLKSMNLAMLLTFADGTLALTNAFVSHVMLEDAGKPFDDALAAMIASGNASVLPQQIVRHGLEGLRNEAAKESQFVAGPADLDPYDVFCGLIVKYKDSLAPQYRKPVENYLRLFQAFVRPPISPHVQAQIEARRKATGAPARGGWDEG
jgi:hypothetical protein